MTDLDLIDKNIDAIGLLLINVSGEPVSKYGPMHGDIQYQIQHVFRTVYMHIPTWQGHCIPCRYDSIAVITNGCQGLLSSVLPWLTFSPHPAASSIKVLLHQARGEMTSFLLA